MNASAIKDYRILLFLVAIIWLIELVNIYLGHSLNQYGLLPRHPEKLYGIVSMHFLHGSLMHLIANSLPMLVLSFLVYAPWFHSSFVYHCD